MDGIKGANAFMNLTSELELLSTFSTLTPPPDQNTLGLDGRRSPSDAAATDSPVWWTADSLCRENLPSAGARRKYG